jgi:DNA-binding SARP family transcriptional activator
LERTISIRLAVDAFRRKEYAEAIDRAWDVVAMDPLDEEPWEIVLRVQLAIGKRGTALADFLRYGDLLKRELGTEPPLRFRELLSLQN